MTDLLDTKQAADQLGISPDSIRELCKLKKIKHYRVGPRGWNYRFKPEWINEYLESCIIETAAQTKKSVPKKRKARKAVNRNEPAGFRRQLLEEHKSGDLG